MRNVYIVLCVVLTISSMVSGSVILNEYNAVDGSQMLDDGSGSDTFFGTVEGNGGDWLELVVVEDVSMVGWKLEFQCIEDDIVDSAYLTLQGDFWSNVRSGTIITFVEKTNAGGFDTSTDTSVNYQQDGGDWWVNICTKDEFDNGALGLCTNNNEGKFMINEFDWSLTIRDSQGQVIQGPIGEGDSEFPGGINEKEACRLEANPSSLVTILDYDDAKDSTFGQANQWGDNEQDFTALRSWAPVPEPLTLSLIFAGGIILARKKR